MKLEGVLEKLKTMGNYGISLNYGEGIGCDDSDVSQGERAITILMTPVGYLGEIRVLFKTNLNELEKLKHLYLINPVSISNPPKKEDYKEFGFYFWGTEESVEMFKKRGFMG